MEWLRALFGGQCSRTGSATTPPVGWDTPGNDLTQLQFTDIRTTAAGTPFIDINDLDDDDPKSVETTSGDRHIPMHPVLIEAGLKWRDALAGAGYVQLFPELRYDEARGFGRQARRMVHTPLCPAWLRTARHATACDSSRPRA